MEKGRGLEAFLSGPWTCPGFSQVLNKCPPLEWAAIQAGSHLLGTTLPYMPLSGPCAKDCYYLDSVAEEIEAHGREGECLTWGRALRGRWQPMTVTQRVGLQYPASLPALDGAHSASRGLGVVSPASQPLLSKAGHSCS